MLLNKSLQTCLRKGIAGTHNERNGIRCRDSTRRTSNEEDRSCPQRSRRLRRISRSRPRRRAESDDGARPDLDAGRGEHDRRQRRGRLFSAESRRPDAVSASNDAAKRGNAAIEALKRFSDKIDVGTTGLSTNPVYTRAKEGEVSEIGVWEARETLRVTVRDVSVVSDVLAAVVGHMNYEGIPFRVSDKAERAQRDELLKAAVADALRQAGIVAESIGRKSSDVSVASVRIGSHSAGGPRYYAAPMMKAERASANVAPAVIAGTTEVSLTVTVEARLPR